MKKILHEGHDIAMAASRLSTFFDAKDKLLEASHQVENPSLLAKTFGEINQRTGPCNHLAAQEDAGGRD